MGKTKIAWATKVLNFYTWNCNKVSPGCEHCYAEAQAKRWNRPAFAGTPQWRESSDRDYLALRAGDIVFVNSMSDTFHKGVPDEWIHRIFDMAAEQSHVFYLLLTKRIERAAAMASSLHWADNIWIGTSVENEKYARRIDVLRQIPAAGRFVSFEPLLDNVGDISLAGIDWAIVGGESGEHRREFDKAWAQHIRYVARRDGAAFFFKQGSDRYPGKDRLLNGREYNEFPPAFGRSAESVEDVPALPLPRQTAFWKVKP
jgi:protein gp37